MKNRPVLAPFPTPNVAVDVVLVSLIDNQLHVLLIKINSDLYKNHWALPGGLVHYNEELIKAASRVLLDKTGAVELYLEQLYTFTSIDRDPRSRTISIAYLALVQNIDKLKFKKKEYYSATKWYPIDNLPDLIAFDHKEILDHTLRHLRSNIDSPKIASKLLPQYFTLAELQTLHECVLNQKLDKRNFRKKILLSGMLKKTSKFESGKAHRPAKLFTFS